MTLTTRRAERSFTQPWAHLRPRAHDASTSRTSTRLRLLVCAFAILAAAPHQASLIAAQSKNGAFP